jgi:flagellar basal-body rod protein FlgB
MGPVYLFDLVSRHNQWLSVRQTVIAGNVANANTPGFRALDVKPFEAEVEQAKLKMAATRADHLSFDDTGAQTTEVREGAPWDVTHSGNSVSLEQEMIKGGEVGGAFRLNTSILKAFHRMMLASSKG